MSAGLLGYVVVALSAATLDVRRLGYEIVGRYMQQLQLQQSQGLLSRGGFSERPQVQLLLKALQGAISKPFMRLPALIGVFVAEGNSYPPF